MKSRLLLGIVGLAVVGAAAAVLLLREERPRIESAPRAAEIEPAPASASEPATSLVETAALSTPATADVREEPVASEQRAAVGSPVIRGRVIEAETGLARAGIELELTSRSDTIATAVTDAQGRFELPFSQSTRLAVELVEPEGWRAARRRQRISGDEPPAGELVFELHPIPGVAFHGRAIDEVSGEPLPFLNLSVGSDLTLKGVETDADGLFTSRQRYEAGQVGVALIIAEKGRWLNSERSIDFDGTARVHDVPLPIGSTYNLHVALPPGYELESLRAFLSDSTESCPWTLTGDRLEGAVLHEAAPPWVRFLEAVEHAPEGGLNNLWICTADGRWLGSCQVPWRSSRASGAHEVSLFPCGALEVDPGAQVDPQHLGLRVNLRQPSGEECWGRRPVPGANGRFHIRLVPPGDYVLSVEGNRIRAFERTVQVAAGEPTRVNLALEFLPSGGSIAGFVRSQSGRYQVTRSVSLSPIGERSGSFHALVDWSKDGEVLVGRFAFEDVPAGEYELSASSGLSHFDWRTSSSTISPPATDVELLCLDGAGGVTLEVEAYDALTGKPVNEISISFGGEPGLHSYSTSTRGDHRLELGRFPRDTAFQWGAESDGYVAIAGDISSFQQTGTANGEPVLRARLELQPGWGGRVLAYTETERIPDAVVLCDDIEVGRTNKRGELDFVLPARPRRFEVRHPGFVMQIPATGQVPDDDAVLLVYMKQRQ
jgi:hypothetical protein